MPRVSVVIPAYNAERYVGEAIQSVRRQSVRDIEIIVIDDGSTDGTLAQIEAHAEVDSRIRVVSRPNRGIVATPNEGILLAESPWVAMLDADDLADMCRLEKQLLLAKEMGLTVVGSQIEFFGGRLGKSHFPVGDGDIRHQLYVWKNPIANPSVMFSKTQLSDMGYDERFEHAQDYALWLKLCETPGVLFGNHREALTLYRAHSQQNTSKNRQLVQSACVNALSLALKTLGGFDERAFAMHVKALQRTPVDKSDDFYDYSLWLVEIYRILSKRFGESRELFNFWLRVNRDAGYGFAYHQDIASGLDAGWSGHLKYYFKQLTGQSG